MKPGGDERGMLLHTMFLMLCCVVKNAFGKSEDRRAENLEFSSRTIYANKKEVPLSVSLEEGYVPKGT